MKVADFTPQALRRQLGRDGLRLRTGPIVANIRTSLDTVADDIALHYAEHFVAKSSDFADFHVTVERPRNIRRRFPR